MQFKFNDDDYGNYFTALIPEGSDFTELPAGTFEAKVVLSVASIDNEDGQVTFCVHEMTPGKTVETVDDPDEDETSIEDVVESAEAAMLQRKEDED